MNEDLDVFYPLSPNEQRLIFWVPKCTGLFSFFGSVAIIWQIVSDRTRLLILYHRIIFLLSVNNILLCISSSIGSLPIPKDAINNIYGSSGTNLTCSIQGFLLLYCHSVSNYYVLFLSIFAITSVKNNFKTKLTFRRETLLHCIIHVFSLIMPTISIFFQAINPAVNLCFVALYPMKCEDKRYNHPCLRGENNTFFFRIMIVGGSAIIVSLCSFLAVSLATLNIYVRTKEAMNKKLTGKWKFVENARKKKSRMISRRASLYAYAWILSSLPTTINRVILNFSSAVAPTFFLNRCHFISFVWYFELSDLQKHVK
mmetsp:Transcript_16815/g.23809  ORF Transcript_16815/g.23809 Transcript_16815/m.23809 type:complete len:313 (+) Transcript_16815:146-1084(+)